MDRDVHMDEFMLGGKENGKVGRSYDSKKKTVTALQITEYGKVKRMYAIKIDNFSVKELMTIFKKHISKDTKVTIDL